MNLPLALSAAFLTASALAAQPNSKPILPDLTKTGQEVQHAQKKIAAETADVETRAKAEELIAKASKYLRSRQDKATGGWSIPQPDKDGRAQPVFPAITGLVLIGLLQDPAADIDKDPAVAAAVTFLLKYQQPDGGIYDRILPCYNTSLAVSALSRVHSTQSRAAVEKAVIFLKSLQWSEAADGKTGGSDSGKSVPREHPFYGGVGYGKSGRPDNSNLAMFMQALEDAGVSPQDEAVKRAIVFLQRTQMDDRVNTEKFAKGSRQGGFVYSTAEDAQSVESRPGQSEAGMIEETLSDGTTASHLRAYGSMTYAGFKSYIYAELPRDDQRVTAAYGWIRRNYSVDENPGLGAPGQYYYYMLFSKALHAWGEPTVKLLPPKPTDKPTSEERNWRADLVNKLASLQNPDGSFRSLSDRWLENNPDLITAYALGALCEVVK